MGPPWLEHSEYRLVMDADNQAPHAWRRELRRSDAAGEFLLAVREGLAIMPIV